MTALCGPKAGLKWRQRFCASLKAGSRDKWWDYRLESAELAPRVLVRPDELANGYVTRFLRLPVQKGIGSGSWCAQSVSVFVCPLWRSVDLGAVVGPGHAAPVRWRGSGPVGHLAVVAPCACRRSVLADQLAQPFQAAERDAEPDAGGGVGAGNRTWNVPARRRVRRTGRGIGCAGGARRCRTPQTGHWRERARWWCSGAPPPAK